MKRKGVKRKKRNIKKGKIKKFNKKKNLMLHKKNKQKGGFLLSWDEIWG